MQGCCYFLVTFRAHYKDGASVLHTVYYKQEGKYFVLEAFAQMVLDEFSEGDVNYEGCTIAFMREVTEIEYEINNSTSKGNSKPQ